jgi:dTDP-4-dehydrorhamnose reductase
VNHSILLFGGGGQIGRALRRDLAPLGTVKALTHQELDIGDTVRVRQAIAELRPDMVVNAAAYTAVDKAETEREPAMRINAQAVRAMAEASAQAGALLVHYSTDYVFDGSKPSPYREDDPTNPLSVYGATKLAGEEAIRSVGAAALVFRTSWVFGPHGGNFVKTMLRLALSRDALRVIADQVGQPTPADLASGATALVLCRLIALGMPLRRPEVYHLASGNPVSWHGFACAIVEEAARAGFALKANTSSISAISTAEYPLPAPRPMNSRLDVSRIETDFGLSMPDWRPYLVRMLQDLKRPEHD